MGCDVSKHLVSLSFLLSIFLTPLIAFHHSSFDLPTASYQVSQLCICAASACLIPVVLMSGLMLSYITCFLAGFLSLSFLCVWVCVRVHTHPWNTCVFVCWERKVFLPWLSNLKLLKTLQNICTPPSYMCRVWSVKRFSPSWNWWSTVIANFPCLHVSLPLIFLSSMSNLCAPCCFYESVL